MEAILSQKQMLHRLQANMKNNKIFLLFFIIFLPSFAWTQELAFFEVPEKREVVQIPNSIDLGIFRAGEKLRVALPLSLSDGWYIYSIFQDQSIALPSKLEFLNNLLKKEATSFETTPLQKNNSLDIKLLVHKQKPRFYQNFSIPKSHILGKQTFFMQIVYQLCSDRFCFPPETNKIALHYNIKQGEPRAKFLTFNRQIDKNAFISASWKKIQNLGFWNFIFLALLSGYLAWLTPCAIAILPLIILFFSNNSQKKKNISFKQILFFTVGISVAFTIFGLVVSSVLSITQLLNIVNNGWSFLLASFFFLIFALSFLNLFSFFPATTTLQRWQDMFLRQSQKKKYNIFKVLLGGALFTITTFSCTFPLVGSLLVATSFGSWFYPIIGMLLFSFAFISPLLLFFFFPQYLTKWKNWEFITQLKFLLGLLAVFVAAKFLSYADIAFEWKLISRDAIILFWIFCLFLWLLSLIIPIFQKKKYWKNWSISLCCVIAVFIIVLSQGIQNKSLGSFLDLLLPPASEGYLQSKKFVSKNDFQSLIWLNSLEEAQNLAQKLQKPIFIDFSGKTCTNCRWMEQSIFPQTAVFETLKENFILVRLYTDIGDDYQENLELQKNRFGNIALPFYVVLSSGNVILKQQAGVMSKKQFQAFLKI